VHSCGKPGRRRQLSSRDGPALFYNQYWKSDNQLSFDSSRSSDDRNFVHGICHFVQRASCHSFGKLAWLSRFVGASINNKHNFKVASSSIPICSVNGGNLVTLIGIGPCLLNANQPGDGVNYAAAPQLQQSFNVNSLASLSSLPQLLSCSSNASCVGNLTGLFETNLLLEAGFSASQSVCNSPNCSLSFPPLPWLIPCIKTAVTCKLQQNAQRALNLDIVVRGLLNYSAQCISNLCTVTVATWYNSYLTLTRSVAIICLDPICSNYRYAFGLLSFLAF
jgi:hypothetical protein